MGVAPQGQVVEVLLLVDILPVVAEAGRILSFDRNQDIDAEARGVGVHLDDPQGGQGACNPRNPDPQVGAGHLAGDDLMEGSLDNAEAVVARSCQVDRIAEDNSGGEDTPGAAGPAQVGQRHSLGIPGLAGVHIQGTPKRAGTPGVDKVLGCNRVKDEAAAPDAEEAGGHLDLGAGPHLGQVVDGGN